MTFLDVIDHAVVAQAPSLTDPFTSLGASALTGDVSVGSVTSDIAATEMFLAIGRFDGEVSSKLAVYNAVSPNEDGLNDFLKILNIGQYPNNIVTIYTRWGDKVFEMTGYDNIENKFDGQTNIGKGYLLQPGTYYYVIEKGDGSDDESGFLVLRN